MKPYIRTVQYYETDKMAIVHHSNYIRWFEEARIFVMEQIGYPYKKMEEEGIMIPVMGVSAEYKTGVRYGDVVSIDVKVTKFNGIKTRFEYVVTDCATGEFRMRGTSDHCFVDSNFKPCNMKKKNIGFYNAVMDIVEE